MFAFRIAKQPYARDLSGKGAELQGGRWNSEGTRMLYAATSRSLALVESLVHLPGGLRPEGAFELITLRLEGEEGPRIELSNLVELFRDGEPRQEMQRLGDEFIREASFLYGRAPSVIVPEEDNILVNPLHPRAQDIRVMHARQIRFDVRLFR